MKLLTVFLVISSIVSSPSFGATNKGVASVVWRGLTIVDGARTFGTDNWLDLSLASPSPKIVDCALETIPSRCWKHRVSPKAYDVGPGADLQFVRPFPVLTFLSSEFKHDYRPDASNMKKALNHWIWIGTDTEQTAYVPVEKAFKGSEVVALWKALINIMPPANCDCSIVLSAKLNGEDAIAYCEFESDEVRDGLPANCEIVAYRKKDIWYLLSYTGAEQCSGCGAADDDSCTIGTEANVEKVAAALITVMRNGITHLELKQIESHSDEHTATITLQGKNDIVDSKWERGHFEKAAAKYQITKYPGGVSIAGTYRLLVSVEPISTSQNWHDVQDLQFFHERILNLIKNEVGSKLSKSVNCDAAGASWAD
jgi:hypothetical protein